MDGIDYRKAAGDVARPFGDPRALYIAARDDGVSPSDFGRVSLLLPSGSGLNVFPPSSTTSFREGVFALLLGGGWSRKSSEAKQETAATPSPSPPWGSLRAAVSTALAQFSPTGGGLTGYSDALYTTALGQCHSRNGSPLLSAGRL